MFWGVTPSGFHQYESIPCVHAISAILCLNGNIEEYVAVWYTTQNFRSCYRYNVKPIIGYEMWPTNDMNTILPPKRRRMSGRPKMNMTKYNSERSDRHTLGPLQNVAYVPNQVIIRGNVLSIRLMQ
uniref:Zinc finger PMZ-type domain-containing protein n=1 Tax=Lactuca sativa TaxID=4236 RepID=A0A9R1XCR2_LACSA|nr:hypothetical protein LSAT_V11C400217420 [Lactuca sativa]